MTCPTTAVFDGLTQSKQRIPLGKHLRYFGDGYQKSKLLDGRRFWRVPVMDGEFLVEESIGCGQGVGGGNIIIQADTQEAVLAAARRGVEAAAKTPGVITPFPGGVARSGSKVGSRYRKLKASTSDAYCPTLRGRVRSQLHRAHIACWKSSSTASIKSPSVERWRPPRQLPLVREWLPSAQATTEASWANSIFILRQLLGQAADSSD